MGSSLVLGLPMYLIFPIPEIQITDLLLMGQIISTAH